MDTKLSNAVYEAFAARFPGLNVAVCNRGETVVSVTLDITERDYAKQLKHRRRFERTEGTVEYVEFKELTTGVRVRVPR